MSAITCFRCGKTAAEVGEYDDLVFAGEYRSADEAVRDDGTYNPVTGHFCCTECYIAIGMPSSPRGWRAP